MKKFFICVMFLAAFGGAEWAYAQCPGQRGPSDSNSAPAANSPSRSPRSAPIMRGQAKANEPKADFKRAPMPAAPRPAPAPEPIPRPAVAPPPPPASAPAPERPHSFLTLCLPFLTLGLSK